MKFHEMTAPEIRGIDKQQTVVVLPIAAVEQHGPHLPTGTDTIICGANQPFRESRLGETETFEAADHAFDVVPDCVASLGMARAFYHFMSAEPGEETRCVFDTVSETMSGAVGEMVSRQSRERGGLVESAISIALDLARVEADDLGDVIELGS